MATIPNIFTTGRMDSDTHYAYTDNKGYVYALNLRPSGYGEDGALHFIKGSELISDFSENKTMTVVGQYAGENNKLYTFLARKDGLSKITETDIVTKETRLVAEDVKYLRFDLLRWENCEYKHQKYLLSVNQVGDSIVFSNEVWENPRSFNINTDYSEGFDIEDIVLNKKPPQDAPRIISGTPSVNGSSDVKKDKFVSFAYRYKYADGSFSPYSFYSDVAFREGNVLTNNNKRENTAMVNQWRNVVVRINSGDFRVKGIEVIAREHGTNNGYVIYTADKETTEYNGLPIGDNQLLDITYNFSNNYTMADDKLLDMIYSNVPKYPKTQDYIGSRLMYGNYKEGFPLKTISGENINIDIDYSLQTSAVDHSVSKKTVVSGFSYKIGIVYANDYGESSTVLLNNNDLENEITVPFANRLTINKIKAKVKHEAPAFATKFQFVVQSQPLNYENIYSSTIRKVGGKLYILLNGDNINKLKVNDKFFLTGAAITNYNEFEVKEVKVIQKQDLDLGQSGTFAISEGFEDFDIKNNEGAEGNKSVRGENNNLGGSTGATVFSGVSSTISGWSIGDVKVNDRATISFTIEIRRNRTTDAPVTSWTDDTRMDMHLFDKVKFEHEIIASSDYDNIYDFISDNLVDNNLDFIYTDTSIKAITNENFNNYVKNNMGSSWNAENISGHRLREWITMEIRFQRGSQALEIRTVNKETVDTYFFGGSKVYKVVNGVHVGADSSGSFDVDFYNGYTWGTGVESYKIKDGVNSKSLDKRFKPNDVDVNGYGEKHRKNDITYGGLYNEDVKINELNTFNTSTVNWKELPTEYGEIQRIISTDGDITVFCNDKVINLLYGKSVIADLQGNENLAMTNEVLGSYQILPYEYGTQHPESVVKAQNLVYFVDQKRKRYLVKGGNQIMELNATGSGHLAMGVEDLNVHSNYLSSYNESHGEYISGLNHNGAVVYNPQVKGFSHYYDYNFDFIIGMNGKHFSSHRGVVYEDEATEDYNSFAGQQGNEAIVTYVVNPQLATDKHYKAMMLQSNTGWNTDIKTNLTQTRFPEHAYEQRESFFYTEIYRDNATSQTASGIGEVFSIAGNEVTFSFNIPDDVSSGDKFIAKDGDFSADIIDISGKTITLSSVTGLDTSDFSYAEKQSDGYFSPDGAPMRGKWMEVTLSKSGSEPYYVTTASTEVVESK